ncbi:hypothetical protein NUU61_007771 [Penicillium alfredii]|uniref:Uncharacterized protein n=1 Tax=Penicillium alfredii TaxID=1506179 RepID=A0A9W9ERA5_9EURO|nr:uncharacterized protein NUU61_007771 [Penicillium alfredii]KAJ5086464.1 hypothetical protein NUU61_007771 [Penicillium alfredii]
MASQGIPPGMSSYPLPKMAVVEFTGFLNREHPGITSVSLDPGVVPTNMGLSVPFPQPFVRDAPELSDVAAVWLSSCDKSFLSDVEELKKRKEEISDGELLMLGLKGSFGEPNVVVEG